MNGRPANKPRLRRCRRRRRCRWSFFPARRGRRRQLGRRVRKQVLQHIKSRAMQRLVEFGRRPFYLGRRRQIRSLLAQLAEGRRRLDHHHPAAFRARQNLPNCRLIAHPQPRPARRTRDCKSFHAAMSRVRGRFAPAPAPLQNGLFPRAKSRWQSSNAVITHEYLPAISTPSIE